MEKISKYKIIEELGKGAMGIVYKALDPDINREVAIKTIHIGLVSEESEKEEMMKRFMREAQAAGQLLHPNIITIYDIGREKDLAYIVMQYVEGQSLQRRIVSGEKFSEQEIVHLMSDLCSALDYAHQNGIVHRDIKPANVILNKNGKPFIADFGVVYIEASTLTQEGTTIGTPSYMSPEQVMGKKVDNRSDIFSLGAILYELLTGKKPFGSESITTVIYKIINEKPLSLREVKKDLPAGFQQVIDKALAKNPEDRYQTCSQFAGDLHDLDSLSEKTFTLHVTKELEDLEKKKKTKAGLILAIFLAAIIIVVGGAWYFSQKTKEADIPSKEVREMKAEESLSPLQPVAVIPDSIEDKLSKVKENFERENFAEAARLAEQILSEDANNKTAREYLNKSKNKMNEALIAQTLSAGVGSYKKGDYEQCLQEMEKILKLDEGNKEAQRYWYLADTAISRKEITKIIERQRSAEEKKDLLLLLSDIDSPSLSNQREEDATLLFNYYDDIKSLVSNVSMKFKDRNHAEVNFSHLLTAVYKKTSQRKVIFEGIKTWKMKKQGRIWKIIE